ncbi:HAMP domain-containing sensor histidine kinase [Lapillicoccus sp.]|uniref:sensor histidine kinase n=1 Tax=Lapillicoccus sp. TaxID=1909287 RepID=UPI0025F96BFE|nr:HAMP domain-containing sensor histidine kinase [Lapillicoccus sp.]
MRIGQTLRDPSSWTLRSKLVASTLALFLIITVITSAATVLTLRSQLVGQVDQQLDGYFLRPGGSGDDPAAPSPNNHSRGPGNDGLRLIVADSNNTVLDNFATTSDGTRVTLTSAQISLLGNGLGRAAQTVDLGSPLGDYRLVAGRDQTNSATVIIGLPLGPQERTVSQMAIVAGLTTIIGLLLVGIGGLWVVRRALRPLDRVAATATRVAQLPLDRGQVALAERVPEEDTDVRTEVGQVGAALNEMLDHVDEALQARQESEQRVRQFVADASHELRTPLASIRGYAELTKREREPVPATVSHALGRVESEAIRMTSLVEDLLLLARLDAGRPLDAQPVDLTEMVVNAVSDAHAASPAHSWQLDLPDEPVEVRGDGARLHQIVANLLANARTHTAPGTVVRTSLAQEGDRARITVHDNGPGVPIELQPHVFERFARGDTSRNRAGGSTGLGLSIVSAVVQAHGGTVRLDSRPGDTTFSVLLPA